jgi:hypothetical protein
MMVHEVMASRIRVLAMACVVAAGAGCASRVDIEKVPIGTRVDVTRQDGGVVRGTLTSRDDRDVRMSVGNATRAIPRGQIASVQLVDDTASSPASLPPAARFREYTVPAGTVLHVRLDSSLGSDSSHVEDAVGATLTDAVRVESVSALPEGSALAGVVTTAERSGDVTGRASLAVQFHSITVSGSETYALSAGMHYTAASTKGDDAKTVGIPAAGGAVIGALFGGKKGAGIGALIGGGAGAAVVLTTSGPEVRYASGTVLSLTLEHDIDVRVPIRR